MTKTLRFLCFGLSVSFAGLSAGCVVAPAYPTRAYNADLIPIAQRVQIEQLKLEYDAESKKQMDLPLKDPARVTLGAKYARKVENILDIDSSPKNLVQLALWAEFKSSALGDFAMFDAVDWDVFNLAVNRLARRQAHGSREAIRALKAILKQEGHLSASRSELLNDAEAKAWD